MMRRSCELEEIKIQYNHEIALLLLCCRVFLKTESEEELKIFLQQNDINWKKVYHLSTLHRIRPVVFAVLNNVKELVDKTALEQFQFFCKRFASLSFSKKLEADRLISLLRQQAISARLYKGVDFAHFAYGDIGMREFSDMDIIIEKKDIAAIVRLMKEEGYELKEKEFYIRFPKQFLRIHKDIVFQKKHPDGSSYVFEFHFAPIQYFSAYNKSFAELLGDDYLSPGKEFINSDYFKLMLVNNGAADYLPHLRSLLDLSIIYKNANNPALHESCTQLNRFILLWHFLSSHLFYLPPAFTTGTFDKHQQQVSDYLLNKILNVKDKKRIIYIKYSYFNILFSDGIKAKWNQFLRSTHFLLSPNGNDIAALKLPFYFLYYFTKPFRLLFNLFSY